MSHLKPIYAVWDHNAEAMASDIGEPGVKVRQWRNRGNIPANYWQRIISAAARRGVDLTLPMFLPPSADQRADEAAGAVDYEPRRVVLCALCDRRVDRGVIECTAIDCPHSEREAA